MMAPTDLAQLMRLRLALAETFLKDSHQPSLSPHGRVSAAFDAGYLAVLVITGAGSAAGQEHPDAKTLSQGKELLSQISPAPFEEALYFLEKRYDPAAQFDLAAMQVWAAGALKAAKG
jgi:hypothetical protein